MALIEVTRVSRMMLTSLQWHVKKNILGGAIFGSVSDLLVVTQRLRNKSEFGERKRAEFKAPW